MAYRKFYHDRVTPSWSLYRKCAFLEPFVNLKPDYKRDEASDTLLEQTSLVRLPPKSPFDEHRLTHLVRERPVLYDKQHEDFRACNLRKIAWIEISKVMGWDVKTIQKRWRVMRDRFVRELRRTKNTETDAHVNCSNFFREMLFLVKHVKSKNYEAEAELSDTSQDGWEEHETKTNEKNFKIEKMETCIIADSDNVSSDGLQIMEEALDGGGHVVTYSLEEGDQYIEYGADESSEPEESEGDEVYEEVLEDESEEQQLTVEQPHRIVTVQETSDEQWLVSSSSKKSVQAPEKRCVKKVENVHGEPSVKRERLSISPSPPVAYRSTTELPEPIDEDIAFGQTIGLMLRKIPKHLKTSVKLKIFQSLAEFESEHKLG